MAFPCWNKESRRTDRRAVRNVCLMLTSALSPEANGLFRLLGRAKFLTWSSRPEYHVSKPVPPNGQEDSPECLFGVNRCSFAGSKRALSAGRPGCPPLLERCRPDLDLRQHPACRNGGSA